MNADARRREEGRAAFAASHGLRKADFHGARNPLCMTTGRSGGYRHAREDQIHLRDWDLERVDTWWEPVTRSRVITAQPCRGSDTWETARVARLRDAYAECNVSEHRDEAWDDPPRRTLYVIRHNRTPAA